MSRELRTVVYSGESLLWIPQCYCQMVTIVYKDLEEESLSNVRLFIEDGDIIGYDEDGDIIIESEITDIASVTVLKNS